MRTRRSIAAYCICHYGLPYIAAAVESLYDQVDHIYIAYTNKPSQSFQTEMTCPDTKEDLLEAIKPFMDKVTWAEGSWEHEVEHCDYARSLAAADHDWLVRFDTDEIFPEGCIEFYINEAEKSEYREWRMPFMHFWRSFSRVCRDASHPIRLGRKEGEGLGWLPGDDEKYTVCHMGYAMPTKYIDYKMAVSGHKSEWRPDWYEKRWLANAQEDTHPVCWNPPLWNPEEYDITKLPEVLKKHEYYGKEVIN